MVGRQQLVDVARDLDPRVDEDDQVVTDPFEVGDEVRGENDTRAVLGNDLHETLKELTPCERIEARHGFVEQEKLRSLRHRQGQGQLGALAARELACLLVRVKPEAHDAILGQPRVPARVHPGAEAQVVTDRHPRVGRCVLGDETYAGKLVRCHARATTEDGDRPGARLQKADGQLEQRGLAGAIGPDEPDDLAGGYGERAPRGRPLLSIALAEAIRLQDGGHATSSAEED